MDTGIYTITIDDKGRFLFPNKMRKNIEDGNYVLTYAVDKCLQIITLKEFDSIKNALLKDSNPMLRKANRNMLRRFVAPAVEVSLDKSGRLSIPRALRDDVGLYCKSEGLLLNAGPFIEIWGLANYRLMNDNLDIEEASLELFNKINK